MNGDDGMDDEVIAVVQASAPRRVIGVGMLYALGGLLIYLALVRPPGAFAWQAFLIGTGAVALVGGEAMRRATALRIVLTREALKDTEGRTLARIDQVKGLDRGAFAFKPTNGFLLTTSQPAPRVWAPGLWWRVGRRVGVGGVTSAGQTKFMAEMIAELTAELAQKNGDA